jgi:BolA protein
VPIVDSSPSSPGATTQGGRIERLRAALQAGLAPAQLEIRDDSAHHAGHAGAREGGHYRVTIVSERFVGVPVRERHRMVYAAVGALMRTDVHALSIDARTP